MSESLADFIPIPEINSSPQPVWCLLNWARPLMTKMTTGNFCYSIQWNTLPLNIPRKENELNSSWKRIFKASGWLHGWLHRCSTGGRRRRGKWRKYRWYSISWYPLATLTGTLLRILIQNPSITRICTIHTSLNHTDFVLNTVPTRGGPRGSGENGASFKSAGCPQRGPVGQRGPSVG